MIWFLEGQSSQREVIEGAMDVISGRIPVVASHRQSRPEITAQADVVLREPMNDEDRIQWAADFALGAGVKVMVVGRSGHSFERQRNRFVNLGIDLVTGGLSERTFELVDDKAAFTAEASRAGLAVVPAITVSTADQLVDAIQETRLHGDVCVKPARGIYGQGFWRIEQDADPFQCFAKADQYKVNQDLFVQAFRSSAIAKTLLVMPFMPGDECSVDMVVHHGRVIAHSCRRKTGIYQTFSQTGPAVDLAIEAAKHFGCDGIVNVQTRDDADGKPHLLEINPRYSGGVGYNRLAGINLPGIFAATRLGLEPPATQWVDGVIVKGITVPVSATIGDVVNGGNCRIMPSHSKMPA